LSLPKTLKLEVKAPRSTRYQLSARDIAGITPDGFLVALLTDRRLRGPRWVVVPAAQLSVGNASAKELAASEFAGSLAEMLNRGWSDWILDQSAWERLLEEGTSGVRSRMAWCRSQHPPRQNSATGLVREAKIVEALDALRMSIDNAVIGRSGAQQEGSIHQILLEDVIQLNGYKIIENPVGVPDIQAQLRSQTLPTVGPETTKD